MSSTIKAVAFDAVGTLIYATPSVSSAYCDLLRECGVIVDANRVRSVLAARLKERIDDANLQTNEELERTFWFELIAELVDDSGLLQTAFDRLFAHFAIAANWCCFDDVASNLERLRSQGLKLLLASNFDHRLHSVKSGLRGLELISDVIVSSEVGWRKPAGQFFEHVCRIAGCEPDEILFVGDDLAADVEGSRRAGMKPVWIDRRPHGVGPTDLSADVIRIQSLEELH